MRISSISESHWSDILNLQSEAYYDVESESLDVLKAKWLQSPEHCFICQDGQQMLGYLLAHSWKSEEPPALYDVLPGKSEGSILFLHDLAVSTLAAGKGVGSELFKQLLKSAKDTKHTEMRLVSVQNSQTFWEKMGFSAIKEPICPSYGDDAVLMYRPLP